MVRNKKLKICMRALVKEVLPFYKTYTLFERIVDKDSKHSNEESKIRNKVLKTPNFHNCVELMQKDNQMKSMQGKLVGTNTSLIIIRDEETCIFCFLTYLHQCNSEYQKEVFDYEYQAFEELFYSDYIRFRDSARLCNFHFEGDQIDLNNGLKITRIKENIGKDHSKALLEQIEQPSRFFAKSDFLIIREYTKRKQIGGELEQDSDKLKKEASISPDLFDIVIAGMRVLKPSGVYRDQQITTDFLTFYPHFRSIGHSPIFENMAVGPKLELVETEVNELRTITGQLIEERNSNFSIAYRRLSMGSERKRIEDKLIDFMVGLEALYLPDGNEELVFRLSLRIAFQLSEDKDERKKIYYFLKDMYKKRSLIVHGSKHTLSEDEIYKTEDILRKSLNIYIKDKDRFSINQSSNSGKQKTEGKLDNIFFN